MARMARAMRAVITGGPDGNPPFPTGSRRLQCYLSLDKHKIKYY